MWTLGLGICMTIEPGEAEGPSLFVALYSKLGGQGMIEPSHQPIALWKQWVGLFQVFFTRRQTSWST